MQHSLARGQIVSADLPLHRTDNDSVKTCCIVHEKQTIPTIKDNYDTPTGSGKIAKKKKKKRISEDNTLDADTSNTKITMEHAKVVTNPVLHVDNDDDFMLTKCKKSSNYPIER